MGIPDIRDHAVREATMEGFNREWSAAIRDALTLEATFKRLSDTMAKSASHGSHIHLVMPNELHQEWWVQYRERHGDLIPRNPAEEPPMMALVDQAGVE